MRARSNLIWALTLALVAIAGGFSWVNYQLNVEAGAKAISLSGFEVFPTIAPILLLQGAALIVGFLLPSRPKRILAGALAAIMLWHLTELLLRHAALYEFALSSSIASITGVAGDLAQQSLLESFNYSATWIGYLGLGVINILALGLVCLEHPPVSKRNATPDTHSDDLWEQQRK